jgi:hypothetical protein
MRGLVKIDF